MKQSLPLAFLALVLSLLMPTARNKNNQEDQEHQDELTELQSLRTQVAEQDPLINMVIRNFAQTQQLEGMISPNGNDELPQSQRAKVGDNLRLINEKMESNRQTTALLNKELAQSGNENAFLQRTIGALQEQLNAKNAEILDLTKELKHKNYVISVLDSMVTGLSNNVESLGKISAAQQAELERQDAASSTVRYCIDTSRDLKDMNIIRNGEVVTEGYQPDHFTRIDLCRVTSIPVYAKKVELKTKHPKSSYRLVKGEDKMLTLETTNPQEFWSLSKILVVQIY